MEMELFTTTDAGFYLGGEKNPIPSGTFQHWRSTGQGPTFLKMGRSVRYTKAALDQFLNDSAKQSTSESAAA